VRKEVKLGAFLLALPILETVEVVVVLTTLWVELLEEVAVQES
jgi:hypothetical protein